MATRKQKLRADAAETPLGKTTELPSAKKSTKVKKTSRGK
jgi:hypothetical protein